MIEVNADFLFGSVGLSPEALVLQKDLELIQSDVNDPGIGEMQHVLNIPHTRPIIRPFDLIKSRIPPLLLVARTNLPIPAGNDHMRLLNGHKVGIAKIKE